MYMYVCMCAFLCVCSTVSFSGRVNVRISEKAPAQLCSCHALFRASFRMIVVFNGKMSRVI